MAVILRVEVVMALEVVLFRGEVEEVMGVDVLRQTRQVLGLLEVPQIHIPLAVEVPEELEVQQLQVQEPQEPTEVHFFRVLVVEEEVQGQLQDNLVLWVEQVELLEVVEVVEVPVQVRVLEVQEDQEVEDKYGYIRGNKLKK